MDNSSSIDNGVISIDEQLKDLTKDMCNLNPFYLDITELNKLNVIPKSILYKTYNKCVIMCLSDNINDNINNNTNNNISAIYEKYLNKSEIKSISHYFSFVQCNIKILENTYNYSRAQIIDFEFLELFNNFHKEIQNIEKDYIIILLDLNIETARLYGDIYNTYTIDNFKKTLQVALNYNHNKQLITNKLFDLLLMSKEVNYWTHIGFCNFNLTKLFNRRRFDKTKTQYNSMSYYSLANTHNKFTDISNVIKSQKNRTFYPNTGNNNIEAEEINYIFDNINIQDRFNLFNALLISKAYCHLVINNKYILNIMQTLIDRHLALYKYLFGYAWLTLYAETCLNNNITNKSRYVFDADTASLLPFFPFSMDDILQNPYLIVPISNNMNLSSNFMGLPMYANYIDYGISTLTEFKTRFNIFTTGNRNTNIFDNFNWTNFGISGSIMPALLIRKHILMELFNNIDPESQLLQYFTTFYGNADIDLMCKHKTIYKFLDSVLYLKSIIEENIKHELTLEEIYNITILISEQYLIDNLDEIKNILEKNNIYNKSINLDYIKENINTSQIKLYFYCKYKHYKLNIKRDLNSNPLYDSYYNGTSISSNIKLDFGLECPNIEDIYTILINYMKENNITEKDLENNINIGIKIANYKMTDKKRDSEICIYKDQNITMKFLENIKYKLKSEKLLHNIEVFRVYCEDFFSSVKNFYLPCVRAYYDGQNAYMLPECISALMTNINIDYKYFSGMRHPACILYKYRNQRGFGTIVNKNEKIDLVKYCNENDLFKEQTLFEFKPINSPLYLSLVQEPNIENISVLKPLTVLDDLIEIYTTKYNYKSKIGIDLFKFKTIDDNGNIQPLNKWIVSAYYELVKNNL